MIPSKARQGQARPGQARQGQARPGKARQGQARQLQDGQKCSHVCAYIYIYMLRVRERAYLNWKGINNTKKYPKTCNFEEIVPDQLELEGKSSEIS